MSSLTFKCYFEMPIADSEGHIQAFIGFQFLKFSREFWPKVKENKEIQERLE